MKKGQTVSEYLIILAVVIIIALIVVGVKGGIPGINGIKNNYDESLHNCLEYDEYNFSKCINYKYKKDYDFELFKQNNNCSKYIKSSNNLFYCVE